MKDTDASMTETISAGLPVSSATETGISETTEDPQSHTETAGPESTYSDASTVTETASKTSPKLLPNNFPTSIPIIAGMSEQDVKKLIDEKIEPLLKIKSELPKNDHEGLIRLIRERVGRLEDEVACTRKDEHNNHEQIKRQLFNLRDEMENRKPEFIEIASSKKSSSDDKEKCLLAEKVEILDRERETLEKQILLLITKMDTKVDTIETKCERNTNDQLSLEEQFAQLNDRVSESHHGVQSISTTSIPPSFFEVSAEIYDEKIDYLSSRCDGLRKDNREITARLDIVEEELENELKVSIDGITATKAKEIAQDENKKLQAELQRIAEEVKKMKLTGVERTQSLSEDSASDGENKFIKSVEKSATNIGIEAEVQKHLQDLQSEIKAVQQGKSMDEERIDIMQRRLQALEGGSAGAIGLLERVDEVEKSVRNELDARMALLNKTQQQSLNEARKMKQENDDNRVKLQKVRNDLLQRLSESEDEILAELEKVKLLAETTNTQSEVRNSFDKLPTVMEGLL